MSRGWLVFTLFAYGATAFRPIPEVMGINFPSVEKKGALVIHHMSQVDEDLRQEIEMNVVREIATLDDRPESSSQRKLLLSLALGSLASVATVAKFGVLPVPPGFRYDDASIVRDVSTAILGGALGYTYVKLCTTLAMRDILSSRDSRKLIHTLSAPLYILMWPLYTPGGRYFAACVPIINAARLYLAGHGDLGESELAKAVSRSGDTKEALGGPFVYVLVLFAAISLFWRSNLVGITALCTMAAGDGMADIIGRRFGKGNRWSFSQNKSMAGSFAFVVSASLCTIALGTWLSFTGCLELPLAMADLIPRVIGITSACALVELVPIGDDNWTVPLSAAVLAFVFLQ